MGETKYIVSRGAADFPQNEILLESDLMYHSWAKRYSVFDKLSIGHILYWYNSGTKKIIWKTRVAAILRVEYSSKDQLISIFKEIPSPKYFDKSVDNGYFLAYKVKYISRHEISLPKSFRMPRYGWFDDESKIGQMIAHQKAKR